VTLGLFGAVLLVAAMASAALAEIWRRFALRRGVIDVPGERSSHLVATPRGAGVGPVLAVIGGLWLLGPADALREATLLAIGLAAAVGLVDDLRPLPPWLKLAGQGLAALPLALAMPWPQALTALPGGADGVLAVVAALAFALLVLNAWNFMDGINGIATLATLAVSIVVLAAGGVAGVPLHAAVLPALLVAAAAGFLPLNLPRARVFMGDCGSHGLGMAVAALVLWPRSDGVATADGLPAVTHGVPAIPPEGIAALAVAAASPFLVDVLGTLAQRAALRERLTTPHRRHLYQRAVRSGYSHTRVAVGYAAWILTSGGVAMAIQALGGAPLVSLAPVLLINALLWWSVSRRFTATPTTEGRP
jgi:UDP-N-acetylmuramyl pentapeptide phosphotransferase/UDP-N-acetylglucosamine-1-phosphate transferase